MAGQHAGQSEDRMTSSELTYTGVLLAVFANQICLPVPSVVFLMAAGAISAHGGMRREHHCSSGRLRLPGSGLDMVLVRAPVGFSGHAAAMPLRCRPSKMLEECPRTSFADMVSRCCVWRNFFPDWMAVMPPLAGAEGVSLAGFLALDVVGSFLWSASYVGLGYIFSNQLDLAIRLGPAFRDRARHRNWGSDRSLCRLAGTDSDANDPSTAPAPHQPPDARSQTEIQE